VTLSQLVYDEIGRHVGRDQAIKRKDLLQYLFDIGAIEKITESEDREVRLIIDENPLICSTVEGYFIAKDPIDYKLAIDSILKRIRALSDKVKRKEAAYPEFNKPGQLELF